MNYISICSGIEAATTAWHPLGWKPLAFSEIEPFPSAVLAHHWPDVPNLGDMTKHNDWPTTLRPDLIVGGTPCQAFSVAGLRQGLADPRGNLTLVFLAILAQYRPKWVVWENVPGVLSDKTGAFGAFLGGLGELGYGFAYRVLDAQYAGVAQRRRRVFVVAHLGDWRPAAAVLFERESLSGDSPPSRETRESVTGAIGARASSGGGFGTDFECDGGLQPVFIDRAAYNQGENAQFDPVIRQDGLPDALVASGPHAVMGIPEIANCLQTTCDDYSRADGFNMIPVTQFGNIAGSLIARHDSSPCADRGQNVVAVCIPINDMATRHAGTNGSGADVGKGHGLGIGGPDDPMFTLTKGDHHAVAFGIGEQPETAHCLRSGASKADKHESTTYIAQPIGLDEELNARVDGFGTLKARMEGGGFEGRVMQSNFAVRRLTPTECARLQGFPDDHCRIPWRGKPAEDCPDGPQYKAYGNSMAVPVMFWIGSRIQKIENYPCNRSMLN